MAAKAVNSHFDDFVSCYDKYNTDFVKAISTYPQYADDIIRLSNTYGNSVIEALKNGITPETIVTLENIGLTPDDFYGKGKIRNLKIESDNGAKALINSRNKIHSLFSDEELSQLKNNVLAYENKYKSDFNAHKIKGKASPAVAGVAYRNHNGELEFFYGVNNDGGAIPGILKKTDTNSELLNKLQHNLNDLDDSIYEYSAGAGSHAEVYAVCELLKKYPDASADDFVVYVTFTKPFDKPAVGKSFYTCPHCYEILKDLNILSNVEGY